MLAFCAFLFFYGAAGFGLTGADEPRYAQIAREMWERRDWIVPTLNGVPWLEKPPLYYWEAMAAYRVAGVGDWAARLPSAFSATLLVVAIYGFARRRWACALDAALITAATAAIIGFVGASTDMPLAANFALGMLCWFAWYHEFDPQRPRHGWLIGFYFFLALATLAKGPVAPGLAAIIIVPFVLLRREPRLLLRTLWGPGVLVFLAVTVPWYWAVEARTHTFLRVFFLEHNLERFASNRFRHPQPFWYYLPVLLAGLAPWTVYGVAAFVEAVRTLRRRPPPAADAARDRLTLFLVLWAVAPVIFFSLSQSKLPGYILPAIPAWTLLLAQWLEQRQSAARPAGLALLVPHALLAAGMLLATILLPYRLLGLAMPRAAMLLAGLTAAAACVGVVWTVRAQGYRLLRFATLVPIVIALGWLQRVAGPSLDATLSARPVAQEIARIEIRRQPVAVFGATRQVEYGLTFYRNQAIPNYDRGEVPAGEHIVVGRAGSEATLRARAVGRRVVRLGEFPPQRLEFWWVGGPGSAMHEHQRD